MKVAETISKLKKETKALRKEVYIIRALLKQQNEIIGNVLEKTYAVKSSLFSKNKAKYFPIMTQEALDKFENSVDAHNRNEIINEVRMCVRLYGLVKAFRSIISPLLIADYNLEGNYDKKRLFNYQNFLDVIYRAVEEESGATHEEFIKELRTALHTIKKGNAKSKWSLSKWKTEVKKMDVDSDENDADENEQEEEFEIEEGV